MYLAVKVTPRASVEKLEKGAGDAWRAWVRGAPVEGKANARLIALVAAYFDVPKASVDIIRGHGSRNKIVRVASSRTG